MKVQPITNNNYYSSKNPNFKSANKFCKYSIATLISSTTLFMLSNGLDAFKSEKVPKQSITAMNTTATLLGILGTGLGLFGIEKLEDSDNDNRRFG